MDHAPQKVLSREIQDLLDHETVLEARVQDMEQRLSGLKDIDLVLTLARVKIQACRALMRDEHRDDGLHGAALLGEKASQAIRLVDGLLSENISEDQDGIIQANPLFAEFRAELEKFIVSGGGGFIQPAETSDKQRRLMSRSIVAAIRRYMGEDDRYPPLDLERYPPFMQKLLLTVFPVFVRRDPEQPPYGIEEGEELTYSSPAMKLPLSQAIHYIENELVPQLEAKLRESPGDERLQEEIRSARERAEEYKKLRFFPRSTPVLLEKGFYTEGMTSYSVDGEMLVPIPLAVRYRSGTNLDRKMELVRMDLVRRIAGTGVSGAVDEEYSRLRSLESGIRGSSRTASMKLDAVWGYRVLRQEFPFLARLSDKGRFLELVKLVQSAPRGSSQRKIAALLAAEPSSALQAR